MSMKWILFTIISIFIGLILYKIGFFAYLCYFLLTPFYGDSGPAWRNELTNWLHKQSIAITIVIGQLAFLCYKAFKKPKKK